MAAPLNTRRSTIYQGMAVFVMGAAIGASALSLRDLTSVSARPPATQPAADAQGEHRSPTTKPATQPASAKLDDYKITPVYTKDGHQLVTFNELAGFRLRVKYAANENGDVVLVANHVDQQIPKAVKELSGKTLAVRGFMFPVDFEDGKTKRFMLIRVVPECLYCTPPAANEWIDVTLDKGVGAMKPIDGPVIAVGELEVGEQSDDGVLSSVYRMKLKSVAAAPDL